MADDALKQLWVAVRRDFDQARALLPSRLSEVEGSVDRLVEWLDHNELELALDELESLGKDNFAPHAYWKHLQSAAGRMGLAEHQTRLGRLAARRAEQGAAADRGNRS